MRDSRQKTARSWTWGVLPGFIVNEIAADPDRYCPGQLLDFGCGAGNITQQLREHLAPYWLSVQGYDLGDPEVLLDMDYTVVHASSVLNVQESEEDLDATLSDLARAARCSDGTCSPVFASYPQEPRKMGYNIEQLMRRISGHPRVHNITPRKPGKNTTTKVFEIRFSTLSAYR